MNELLTRQFDYEKKNLIDITGNFPRTTKRKNKQTTKKKNQQNMKTR